MADEPIFPFAKPSANGYILRRINGMVKV